MSAPFIASDTADQRTCPQKPRVPARILALQTRAAWGAVLPCQKHGFWHSRRVWTRTTRTNCLLARRQTDAQDFI
jgi:hypothetical protein